MRVALVGAGRMGSAMGARVAAAGHDLVVFSRTRSRAEELAARTSARVAGTARDAAASAEICLVSLADDAAVTTTYLADNGLIAGLQPGAVVCDMSTVAPATIGGLTPLVAQKGATLIDTPVSGSVSVVESGTLTVMAGGDQKALDRARPVLDTFAKSIFYLGDIGAGATMKLVVNSLVHSLNVAVSEALVLAEQAGLDRQVVYDVFEASAAGAPYVKYKRAAFLQPGEVPVAFSLDLVAKDQELIHDLAQQTGARMDQAEASRQLVAEALQAGMGERDISEVAVFLRRS
ncbi:MAG TPA: NAD(P)-dependent oxidoreductase [Propionibacteriaceae bacterium]|nr:NAD(P)-dependent oxidoreductase [Propionibacteriaceae bacterium]